MAIVFLLKGSDALIQEIDHAKSAGDAAEVGKIIILFHGKWLSFFTESLFSEPSPCQ